MLNGDNAHGLGMPEMWPHSQNLCQTVYASNVSQQRKTFNANSRNGNGKKMTEDEKLTSVNQALTDLIQGGLIQVDGIDEDGDWIYTLTALGQSLADAVNELFIA